MMLQREAKDKGNTGNKSLMKNRVLLWRSKKTNTGWKRVAGAKIHFGGHVLVIRGVLVSLECLAHGKE